MVTDHSAEQSSAEVFKSIVIHDIGPQKISVIKLLRQMTGLGLTEAKGIADQPVPFVLVVCDEPRALEFQKLAESSGVSCELRDPLDTDQPVIPDDARFGFESAGKSGCAGSAGLLLLVAGGLVYTLIRLV